MMYGNQSYYQQPNFSRQLQPQAYTPPTIHADIILASETEAESYGVAAGTTQMFCARDDSAFYIKTAYPNGQYDFTVYEKREPKKEEKPDYITRSELDTILSQYMTKDSGGKKNGTVRESKQAAANSE